MGEPSLVRHLRSIVFHVLDAIFDALVLALILAFVLRMIAP